MSPLDSPTVLKRLLKAYPEKKLDKDTLQVYLEELADIPAPLLEQAARRHIQVSPWFPHVAELRQAAERIAGTRDFSSLLPPGVDVLELQALALEDAFCLQGVFDPSAWQALASQLERVGRLCRAEEVLSKAKTIQESEAAASRGEQYPSQADRLRYGEWETRIQVEQGGIKVG